MEDEKEKFEYEHKLKYNKLKEELEHYKKFSVIILLTNLIFRK